MIDDFPRKITLSIGCASMTNSFIGFITLPNTSLGHYSKLCITQIDLIRNFFAVPTNRPRGGVMSIVITAPVKVIGEAYFQSRRALY
jgi:hypothetical protein